MSAPFPSTDIDQAWRYLKLLDPSAEQYAFRLLDDSKSGRRAYPFHASEIPEDLHEFQGKQYGTFVSVNQTNGEGQTSEHIIRVRAVWCEADGELPRPFPIPPTMVVRSSTGKHHYYWLLLDDWPADEQGRTDFAGVMRRMVQNYGCDPNAADIARVLRMPGTWHTKDIGNPQMVELVDAGGSTYTRAEILAAFPPIAEERPRPNGYAPPPLRSDEVERLRSALFRLSSDDRVEWINFGMAIKAELDEAGFMAWREWSSKSGLYDAADIEKRWRGLKPDGCIALGTIYHKARQAGWRDENKPTKLKIGGKNVTVKPAALKAARDEVRQTEMDETAGPVSSEDFYAYLPMHSYIFAPTGALWPAASVNVRLGEVDKMKASAWLDRNRAVEQMSWAPGEPPLIKDRLISHGGWTERTGCATFNLYRPPTIVHGDPSKAGPWIEHLRRIYPDDAAHIERWLAQRVQQPGVKINHALVLGGAPGIGKDTLLEPPVQAVGPWNFEEVGPAAILDKYNHFAKSVILRISEARDLGEANRYAFYERSKVYIAAPPSVLSLNEKHIREYPVANVCGVIITSNHRTGGLYLPPDDRRHYVAWSESKKEEFTPEYWTGLWRWYESGGFGHVAAYLASLDLSGFDPKATPPQTEAFWAMVDSERSPEEVALEDLIERLGKPAATTISGIRTAAQDALLIFLSDRKTARQIPHRLATVGYAAVRCPTSKKDGRWVMSSGGKQTIYARLDLSQAQRLAAASRLAEGGPGP